MPYESQEIDQLILDILELQKQIAALHKEINELKQVEASLVKSEQKFRNFIELSSDGIVLIDEEGRIIDWNRGEERITGLKSEEVAGKYVWDVQCNMLTQEQKKLLPYDNVKTLIQNILMTGDILGRYKFYEQTITCRDGSTCIMQVMLFPIKTAKGFMIGSIARDITDNKRMEESLRQGEERYRLLAENAEDFIYIIDRKFTVKYLNNAGLISINRSLEDVIGRPLSELFPPDTFEDMKNNLLKVFETGKPVSVEHLHRFYNKNFWLNVKLSPILDRKGKVICVMGISRDVTEHKMVEEALRESEEKFRVLAETTKAGIVLYKGERILYINPAIENISGYPSEELFNGSFWERLHPDFKNLVKERGLARQHGEPVPSEYEVKMVRKDGEERWLDISASIINCRGAQIGIATFFDTTEHKRAEEALRESEEKFRVLAETSLAAICLYQDDRFLYFNPSTEKITGYTKEELLNKNIWDILHPDYREILKKRWSSRKSGEPVPSRYELKFLTKDGIEKWGDVSVGLINYDGKPTVIIAALDITERKMAEKALEEAKAQVELYVDLMGHDINNMNQVGIGFLEIALDTLNLDENSRSLISKPMSAFENSSRLIDNVRKLQKVKLGGLRYREMDVGEVIADVRHHYSDMHDRDITINYTPASGYVVMANELLFDVFSNLVGNAIKHSSTHPIINIELKKVNENSRDYYRIAVEDNGHGISDDFKKVIFTRQLRGGSQAKGSGIGLYLVKTLIDDYSGRIWVEDRVRGDHTKGARFVVMLPAVEK